MPMGHCGLNRNTIGVHDIENVSCYYFHKLFFSFSWEGEKILCAEINTSSLPESFRVQLLEIKKKFQSTGRVGGYWPIFILHNKDKEEETQMFQTHLSAVWSFEAFDKKSSQSGAPTCKYNQFPSKLVFSIQNLIYTHKKTTFNLHTSLHRTHKR